MSRFTAGQKKWMNWLSLGCESRAIECYILEVVDDDDDEGDSLEASLEIKVEKGTMDSGIVYTTH